MVALVKKFRAQERWDAAVQDYDEAAELFGEPLEASLVEFKFWAEPLACCRIWSCWRAGPRPRSASRSASACKTSAIGEGR